MEEPAEEQEVMVVVVVVEPVATVVGNSKQWGLFAGCGLQYDPFRDLTRYSINIVVSSH